MKTQVLLLLMFFGLGFAQQVSNELAVMDEEGECLQWAYEPAVDFIYPEFGESTPRPLVRTEESFLNDIELLDAMTGYESSLAYHSRAPQLGETASTARPVSPSSLPSDFHAPQFEVLASDGQQQWELLDDHRAPKRQQVQWDLPDEFHAPQFQKVNVSSAPIKQWDLPDDFHAPKFEQTVSTKPPVKQWNLPDGFHAPEFEQTVSTQSPTQEWDLPNDFHAPKFEQGTEQQQEMPDDFHAPKFEQASKVGSDQYGLPDDFHAPKFEDTPAPQQFSAQQMSAAGVLGEEYGLPEYVPPARKWEAATVTKKSYPESVPIDHDGFLGGRRRVNVERADVFPHRADVIDEFVAVEDEEETRPVKKRTRKPQLYKKHKPTTKSYRVADSPRVRDDFAQVDHEKTTVEPVKLPPSKVDVQDEFASESLKEKRREEKKRPQKQYESESWSDSLAQFFLDLVGADAPVHDSFSQGVSHETTVEPIRDYLEPKVEIVDEFTAGSDDKKKTGRSKRSLATEILPNESSLWKRVCVKRRPKAKPAPRTLTAADFVEFAQTTNDHISRCIGRQEGESVAAGLCRKFYLRCAPTISVLMCSKMDEVFSEAQKSCVPKFELKECNLARSIKTHAISFHVSKDEKPSKEELLDLANGDISTQCVGKQDGFYRDNTNCSRVLQCFDNDLFEYPPCANSLAFDLKRELCDYPSKVPSCSN